MTRLPAEPRETLTGFFRAVSDVMLVMIGWILWLGPIGVIALAYVVGAKAGGSAFGALLHYVLIISAVGVVIWLLSFPMGAIGGRVEFGRFVRALSSSQPVAIRTQSSLSSLPAILRGAEELSITVKTT